MESGTKNKFKKPPGGLRMKDLTEAVGLPKSTILHYVNEGLLPEPVRTGPNMAYYHPSTIERAALIRKLKSEHRLPLAAIKLLLDQMDQGWDVVPLIELEAFLFGNNDGRSMNRREFIKATGLTEIQLDDLIKADLIICKEAGKFDREDAVIGSTFKKAGELGLSVEDFQFYSDSAKVITDNELALRKRVTADMEFTENVAATMELTRGARVLREYIIDRTFQQLILNSDDQKFK